MTFMTVSQRIKLPRCKVAAQDILKFAHIARVVVFVQGFQIPAQHMRKGLTSGEFSQEVIDKEWDVLTALPQRRQIDR